MEDLTATLYDVSLPTLTLDPISLQSATSLPAPALSRFYPPGWA